MRWHVLGLLLLPSAVADRAAAIAQGLATSITMGVGQFCTNPGAIVGVRGTTFDALTAQIATLIEKAEPGVMLYGQLGEGYANAVARAGA